MFAKTLLYITRSMNEKKDIFLLTQQQYTKKNSVVYAPETH